MNKKLKIFSIIVLVIYYIVFIFNIIVTSSYYSLDSSLYDFHPSIGGFESEKYKSWDSHSDYKIKKANDACVKIVKIQEKMNIFGLGVILLSLVTIITLILNIKKCGKKSLIKAITISLAFATLIFNPVIFGPSGDYFCEDFINYYENRR